MKKYLSLALMSLLFLTACQQDKTANTPTTKQVDNSAAIAKQKQEEKMAQLNQASFPQLSNEVADNEALVKLITSKGDITIKLFPEQAPLAVENFLTHAKEGYYDGLIFHRVIADFMIQGGDPEGNGTGGQSIWRDKDTNIDSGMGFATEVSDYLYNIRGSLAMANAGGDTNGSQFFINQNTQNQARQLNPDYVPAKIIQAYTKGGSPHLDGRHTVFGQVTEGMDVVDSIAASDTDSQNKPLEDITIQNIEILKDYNFKK